MGAGHVNLQLQAWAWAVGSREWDLPRGDGPKLVNVIGNSGSFSRLRTIEEGNDDGDGQSGMEARMLARSILPKMLFGTAQVHVGRLRPFVDMCMYCQGHY